MLHVQILHRLLVDIRGLSRVLAPRLDVHGGLSVCVQIPRVVIIVEFPVVLLLLVVVPKQSWGCNSNV